MVVDQREVLGVTGQILADKGADRDNSEPLLPGILQTGPGERLGVVLTALRGRDLNVQKANPIAGHLIIQVGGLSTGHQLEPGPRGVVNDLRLATFHN